MRWDIGIDLGTRNVRMVTEGAKEAFAQSAALALRAGEVAKVAGMRVGLEVFVAAQASSPPFQNIFSGSR